MRYEQRSELCTRGLVKKKDNLSNVCERERRCDGPPRYYSKTQFRSRIRNVRNKPRLPPSCIRHYGTRPNTKRHHARTPSPELRCNSYTTEGSVACKRRITPKKKYICKYINIWHKWVKNYRVYAYTEWTKKKNYIYIYEYVIYI